MVVLRVLGASDFWLDEVGETFLSLGFLAYGLSESSAAREWVTQQEL